MILWARAGGFASRNSSSRNVRVVCAQVTSSPFGSISSVRRRDYTNQIPYWKSRDKDDSAVPKEPSLKINSNERIKLEALVEDAVRDHLVRCYPRAFLSKSSVDLWIPNKFQDLSGTMKTFAALNGYNLVPVPKMEETIPLAEGVLAKPNFYSRIRKDLDEKFVLLAQPTDDYAQPSSKVEKKHPALVEEDITIYRILENQVDQYMNWNYHAFRQWFLNRIQRPLQVLGGYSDLKDPAGDSDISLEPTPRGDEDKPPKENLIVIGSKEIVLISNMEPSLRLLALPHALGHKGASTLISVSLVVFGALPLAYRSLNFALIYPGWSEFIAASVVGTVSYGMWSSRYSARTSQSKIVSNAISSRIYARDDAVLWALREGAIRRVSKAVLALYFHHYRNVRGGTDTNATEKQNSLLEMPPRPQTLVDPLDLAVELGLIEKPGDGRNQSGWSSIPLKDASARLLKAK